MSSDTKRPTFSRKRSCDSWSLGSIRNRMSSDAQVRILSNAFLLVLGLSSLENQFDEVSGPDCEFETAAVVPR